MMEPGELAEALALLPVEVTSHTVDVRVVPVTPYEGRGRPHAILQLHGRGCTGAGEYVGWTEDACHDFAQQIDVGSGRLGELVHSTDPYARAAIEGALINLALAQRGTRLETLAGRQFNPVRYVISVDACRDPVSRIRKIQRLNQTARFKVDVHPSWSALTVERLCALGVVDIVDFKGKDLPELWSQCHAVSPGIIAEDGPDTIGRMARDRSIQSVEDAEHAAEAGFLLNIKAPRMGGWLNALRGLQVARQHSRLAYMGGMFELGPGRVLSQQLAALYTASAPNDVAPIPMDEAHGRSPSPLQVG